LDQQQTGDGRNDRRRELQECGRTIRGRPLRGAPDFLVSA
jgi:hypothetical protein